MTETKRVLIIEDEEDVLSVLVKKLEEAGFRTLTAKDGREGLEKALKEKPDLVLLDLVLPVMDGITFLDGLRKEEVGKAMPVVILTNLESAEKVEESRRKGVSDYLVKTDWTLDDVVNKIKQALDEI